MPDKRHTCGKLCIRCWRNRLKHGNKQAKAFMKKINKRIDEKADASKVTIDDLLRTLINDHLRNIEDRCKCEDCIESIKKEGIIV